MAIPPYNCRTILNCIAPVPTIVRRWFRRRFFPGFCHQDPPRDAMAILLAALVDRCIRRNGGPRLRPGRRPPPRSDRPGKCSIISRPITPARSPTAKCRARRSSLRCRSSLRRRMKVSPRCRPGPNRPNSSKKATILKPPSLAIIRRPRWRRSPIASPTALLAAYPDSHGAGRAAGSRPAARWSSARSARSATDFRATATARLRPS